jgi:hypothetical protein
VTPDDKYANVKYWGESAISGSRHLHEAVSKLLTIWMTLMEKSRNPGGFIIDPTGKLHDMDSPYGKNTWVALPENAKPIPLEAPDIATTLPQLLTFIWECIQRADFVAMKYGQLWKGQELSGSALQELGAGAQKSIAPVLEAMAQFYQQAARLLIDQYVSDGSQMRITGSDSKGRPFDESIAPEDLAGEYVIEIKFLATTPEEEAASYAKAQMIKNSELAPDSFIREKIVKFQDPDEVENKGYAQKAEQISPRVMLMRVIKALEKLGMTQEAQVMTIELQKLAIMDAANFAGMSGGGTGEPSGAGLGPEQAFAQGFPGQGIPPGSSAGPGTPGPEIMSPGGEM